MKRGLRNLLAEKLESGKLGVLYNSYDVVGDIAILRVPEALGRRAKEIGEAIMQVNRHIKTVLYQTSPISGDLRLRELRWIAGEEKTETTHKEHGCLFKVDLRHCYFSPRLQYERMRIAQQVRRGEVVVNMFSGVGCFSIIIAKQSNPSKVYSIDVNPIAIRYQRENTRLNRVEAVVELIEGDAGKVVEEGLYDIADRVLMPLPMKAYEYLDYAVMALKPEGGCIHYYDFEYAGRGEDPVEKVWGKVSKRLLDLGVGVETYSGRIVRMVGPRLHQLVIDMLILKR